MRRRSQPKPPTRSTSVGCSRSALPTTTYLKTSAGLSMHPQGAYLSSHFTPIPRRARVSLRAEPVAFTYGITCSYSDFGADPDLGAR